MKKADVKVGKVYIVKVSGAEVPVRITTTHPDGGWYGINETTNRKIRIKTAGRLRRPA